nr:MAG TPA: hypothetical protein [Caudoviricetes sp.]
MEERLLTVSTSALVVAHGNGRRSQKKQKPQELQLPGNQGNY